MIYNTVQNNTKQTPTHIKFGGVASFEICLSVRACVALVVRFESRTVCINYHRIGPVVCLIMHSNSRYACVFVAQEAWVMALSLLTVSSTGNSLLTLT